MPNEASFRKLLLDQLDGGQAHVDFSHAVQGLTYKQTGIKLERVPHTIWELIEHIRIAQKDIVVFCKNPDYEALDFPDDYWPKDSSPNNKKDFDQSVHSIQEDLQEMRNLITDPENNLTKPLAHGDGQTLFREAILILEHNSYHIGQIVLIRRLMGSW